MVIEEPCKNCFLVPICCNRQLNEVMQKCEILIDYIIKETHAMEKDKLLSIYSSDILKKDLILYYYSDDKRVYIQEIRVIKKNPNDSMWIDRPRIGDEWFTKNVEGPYQNKLLNVHTDSSNYQRQKKMRKDKKRYNKLSIKYRVLLDQVKKDFYNETGKRLTTLKAWTTGLYRTIIRDKEDRKFIEEWIDRKYRFDIKIALVSLVIVFSFIIFLLIITLT